MENTTDLNLIKETLENPKDEADRIAAFGQLVDYLETHVLAFSEAYDLYDKYRDLEKDWTAETVSDKQLTLVDSELH